jgi:hypothetical protein
MTLFPKPEPRNWLIISVPNWPNTHGVTDANCHHVSFDQEQSPGISGGTGARKMLTRKEAFAACERLAKNYNEKLNGKCYVPIELHKVFRSNPTTQYEYVEEPV